MTDEQPQYTMSRRARIRAAVEQGTLAQIPVEDLRAEHGFRVNAGLLAAPKGKKDLTKAELVAILGGESETAAPTTSKEG